MYTTDYYRKFTLSDKRCYALEQSGIALAFSHRVQQPRFLYLYRISVRSAGSDVKCCMLTKKKETPLRLWFFCFISWLNWVEKLRATLYTKIYDTFALTGAEWFSEWIFLPTPVACEQFSTLASARRRWLSWIEKGNIYQWAQNVRNTCRNILHTVDLCLQDNRI